MASCDVLSGFAQSLNAQTCGNLACDRIFASLPGYRVEAVRHFIRRLVRNTRSGFNSSGLLLAVATQPKMDKYSPRRGQLRSPIWPPYLWCGSPIERAMQLSFSRFARSTVVRWYSSGAVARAKIRCFAISLNTHGLCPDVSGAICRCPCTQPIHGGRQAAGAGAALPFVALPLPMGANAGSRTCCDCGGRSTIRCSAFCSHVVP